MRKLDIIFGDGYKIAHAMRKISKALILFGIILFIVGCLLSFITDDFDDTWFWLIYGLGAGVILSFVSILTAGFAVIVEAAQYFTNINIAKDSIPED